MLKIAWNSYYNHPLPSGHRFPMIKYDLIPEQLLYEGTISSQNLFSPTLLSENHILSTHINAYWDKLKNGSLTRSEERRTGFPYSKQLIRRERVIVQGTIDCAVFAIKNGVAINVAGGTHHAYTNKGEGFCLLNDIAVGANYLVNEKNANKILVVDLDVHQGDGTAEIFKGSESVFTFSMHGEKNFPLKKQESYLDIPLKDKTSDKEYLKLLDYHLKNLIDEVQPEFIFYQAGVDILATDKLGRLNITANGCKTRDKMVIKTCKKNKIPVAISMGGGYSPDIKEVVNAHANTYRLCQDIYF